MVAALRYGYRAIRRQWKAVFLIFSVQLLLSLILGVQVYHVMEASIGNSLSMDVLSMGFNRTVFEDFFNAHGASVSPLVGMARWIILLYLLLAVFFHGGLLSNILRGETTIASLFRWGVRYYWPFFNIAVVALLTMGIITLSVWIPVLMMTGNPLEGKVSEPTFALFMGLALSIYIILVLHVMLWSLNTRISYIQQVGNLRSHMVKGWQKLWKFWKKQVGVSVLFFLIYLMMAWIYSRVIDDWGARSYLIIWATILLQQVFVLVRVVLRVAFYGGISACCE